MEWYGSAPGASMSMAEDPGLTASLVDLIRSENINVAIETGTYLGMGSTRFIAECLAQAHPGPKEFVTIEANYSNWRTARDNLTGYPFVKPLWGASVRITEATAFIAGDDMLINHQNYHGIYIDTLTDPVGLYTREVQGDHRFAGGELVPPVSILWDGEDLLRRQLRDFGDCEPLIILDSAGGVGLLEFNTVVEMMADRKFHLLLDDIHHVKHHRSLLRIAANPRFTIVAKSHSWVLATYR